MADTNTNYFDYSFGGIGLDTAAGYYFDYLAAEKNYKAAQETNEMNYKIHKENLEWNRPVNQMLRFKEAGLNPNLIYTQGNAGNATAMPVMRAPQWDMKPSQSLANIYAIRNLREQNKNLQAQNNLINAQATATKVKAMQDLLDYTWLKDRGFSSHTGVLERNLSYGLNASGARDLTNFISDILGKVMFNLFGSSREIRFSNRIGELRDSGRY